MKKTLKFSPDLVPLVLSGEKTSTWRLFDDKDLKDGDEMIFIDWDGMQPFAEAMLTSVVVKPLDELSAEDKEGHEKFSSDEEMYATYSRYYKQPVGPETLVKIVRFKITAFLQTT